MSNYLLSCPACGRKTAVSTAQSGQSLPCECGQLLEVPTLRDLRQLEQVGDAERPQATWNRRKGLVFLGCVIMLACGIVGGWFATKLPKGIDEAAVRAEVESLDPASAFIRYQAGLQAGASEPDPGKIIQPPLKPLYQLTFEHPVNNVLAPNEMSQAFVRARARERVIYWFPLIGGAALVGLLITLSALLVRTEPVRRPPQRMAASAK